MSKNLQLLIQEMGLENPTWGEERIANELKLKLGIREEPDGANILTDAGASIGCRISSYTSG